MQNSSQCDRTKKITTRPVKQWLHHRLREPIAGHDALDDCWRTLVFRGPTSVPSGGAVSGIATSYIASDYRTIIATHFPHLIALISEPGIGGEIVSFWGQCRTRTKGCTGWWKRCTGVVRAPALVDENWEISLFFFFWCTPSDKFFISTAAFVPFFPFFNTFYRLKTNTPAFHVTFR